MGNRQNRAVIAVLLSFALSSSANGKIIEGQVFVVTAGAQAIKLPLVQVTAIPKTEIERHVKDTELQISPERAKADAAVTEATEVFERAKRAVAGGFGAWMTQSRQEHPRDPTGQSWADPRTESARYTAAKERLPKAEARLVQALEHQKILQSAAPYFVSLPASMATAKTDADGRFKLTLPDDGDVAIVAKSTRAVFNKVENYFWVIVLKSSDSTVTLSNDNLTTSGSSDSLLTTKE